MMKITQTFVLAALSCSILACGGGGGGGGSKKNNDIPAGGGGPDFDIGDVNLYVIGFGAADAALTLGRLSADMVLFVESTNFAFTGASCGTSGTLNIQFIDTDSSTDLSEGDQIQVSYVNCYGSDIGGLANGTLALTVDDISIQGGAREILFTESISDFSISSDSEETTIEGEFKLRHSFDGNSLDSVGIELGNDSLTYGFTGGDTVSIAAGSTMEKTLDLDADSYTFRFDQILDVDVEGETFTMSAKTSTDNGDTISDFVGDLQEYPLLGVGYFSIAEIGSQCVLAIGSDSRNVAQPDAPALRYSEGEDCMADATTNVFTAWEGIVEDTLFSDSDILNLRN